MNILFYSTNSNHFDGTKIRITTLPSWKDQYQELADEYPEHNFIIATQLPGMFLVDVDENGISEKANNVRYEIIEEDDEDKIAQFLTSLKPDVAIAATFYVTPYDWLTAKDALIAEKLRENGIETICHSVETGLICMDKWKTHQKLKMHGIRCPKAIYIHHSLYTNGGNRREIKSNVYKSCILNEIKKLNFPIIIKDTVGLSSFGMDVLNTYPEVHNYLRSKKFTGDRIIEEMIQGRQFGLEIHGTPSRGYKILSPFMFSVNKYGITSPKQSVKYGPITDEAYNLKELNSMMKNLAESFELNGIAQVDLVLDNDDRWHVIEVNPRLSGMSTTCAVSANTTVAKTLAALVLGKSGDHNFQHTLNMKTGLLPVQELFRLMEQDHIKLINQTENLAAKQERETGYCELILSAPSLDSLKDLAERTWGVLQSDADCGLALKAKELLHRASATMGPAQLSSVNRAGSVPATGSEV